MAEFGDSQVVRGINLGVERLIRHGVEMPLPLVGDASAAMTTAVLRAFPYEVSGRFVELIAEGVVVAHASRLYYGEPELRRDEIEAFVAHCYGFFNSWKHDPP